MKTFRLMLLCASLIPCSLAFAQEGGDMPPMGAPEEMKSTEFLLGDWDVSSQYRMSPDDEWMESPGTAKVVMELDGAVQKMYYEGTMMGMPFTGQDTMYYDREDKRFESFWIDSMSARASMTHGNWVGDKMVATGEDQMMGETVQTRMTTTKVSDDEVHFLMEMSMDGENYFESMKMIYKRKG